MGMGTSLRADSSPTHVAPRLLKVLRDRPNVLAMPLITIEETGGLGSIQVEVPAHRPSITAASRVCLLGIGRHRSLLTGTGFDWGTGSGCLAIVAARIPEVDRVVGIEIDPDDVAAANRNAERNGVADSVTVILGDLYEAVLPADRSVLVELSGNCDFMIANLPASIRNDGLGFRRAALQGATRFLGEGAPVLMQVSYQYGARIQRLAADEPGYTYEGVLETTDWVPFDLDREDLAGHLRDYADDETSGGSPYTFRDHDGTSLTATEALSVADETGRSPLSKWQMHLFRWSGQK